MTGRALSVLPPLGSPAQALREVGGYGLLLVPAEDLLLSGCAPGLRHVALTQPLCPPSPFSAWGPSLLPRGLFHGLKEGM